MASPHKNVPKSSDFVDAPETSVSSDSRPDMRVGDYSAHIWQSLDSVNRELGTISNKLEVLATDLAEVKGKVGTISNKLEVVTTDLAEIKVKVGKHDKIVIYCTASVVVAGALIGALWWLYKTFESHIHFS